MKKPQLEEETKPADRKRKTPERNPVRLLFMEKARLDFETLGLANKSKEEDGRHEAAKESLRKRALEIQTRLSEIATQLNQQPELPL